MASSRQDTTTQSLRSALKTDDDSTKGATDGSATPKVVQIAETAADIIPIFDDLQPKKQFTAGVASKRLSGRLPSLPTSSSKTSLMSLSNDPSSSSPSQQPSAAEDSATNVASSHRRHHNDYAAERFAARVAEWLESERQKASHRKKHRSKRRSPPRDSASTPRSPDTNNANDAGLELQHNRPRSLSIDSQSSDVSLDRLQRILEDGVSSLGLSSIPRAGPHLLRRLSSGHHRRGHPRPPMGPSRTASSDTDYFDGEVIVPGCDGILDNSKTMSYSGGEAVLEGFSQPKTREQEKHAWLAFKNEIIRLTHTLRFKGWRRIPLGAGDTISVERLSGALTNAVYVVCPPADMRLPSSDGKKPPAKLLLRIYGSQVEQLIDRDTELAVLRRLARKKIGPRLLGTFENGRFEEYFNAITLKPHNLRDPETSKQIARRMRELHDGVELLEEEKDAGPAVWKNWDRWLDSVERAALALDRQLSSFSASPEGGSRAPPSWMKRGHVCGVEWQKFKAMVVKYRHYVEKTYGSAKTLRENLVFAHNDTQYGNILRIEPEDHKSPLLQPANKHKQLVVIDFEYAAANVRGIEFANHFTEWAYNYHDETAPWACLSHLYPTPEEQHRFIRAYVDHRPQFPHAGTPKLTPLDTPVMAPTSSSSSIVEFMLDARGPPPTTVPGGVSREEERAREDQSEALVKKLMEESRLWRAANSAQWVAWGLVQAKIPGLEKPSQEDANGVTTEAAEQVQSEDNAQAAEEEESAETDEFDYLSYAQDRAAFFWGDCVRMGLVDKSELPQTLRDSLKLVEY